METIAEELPYAAIVSRSFVEHYCAACFKFIKEEDIEISCDDCHEVFYCSIKCQRGDWRKVHKLECTFLKTQLGNRVYTATMRLCIRVILQRLCLKEDDIPTFNGTVFNDLETNYEEFRSSPEHNQFLSDLNAIIRISGQSVLSKLDAEIETNEIIAIICSVLCNSISITDAFLGENVGVGLYTGLSKHNHACSSKNHIVFNDFRAILRAPKGTRYNKNLTISYVSRMLPTYLRRKNLKNVHFFICECEMCKDEEQDAIALSRRCENSNCDGFCNTYEMREIDDAQCSKCGGNPVIDIDTTRNLTSQLIDEIENSHKKNFTDPLEKLAYFNKLRSKFLKTFDDSHIGILQLDEEIAYCVSTIADIKSRFTKEQLIDYANRGTKNYITRLGLGSVEVTSRMFISCSILLNNRTCDETEANDLIKSTIEKTFHSSRISHGETHPLTVRIASFLEHHNN